MGYFYTGKICFIVVFQYCKLYSHETRQDSFIINNKGPSLIIILINLKTITTLLLN